MTALRLYDFGPSANCLKARILLAHLGLRYERVPVDLFAGETLSAEHRRVTRRSDAGPRTADGECLPESNAILLYLAEERRTCPATASAGLRVHQWLFFEQNLLGPNVGTARFWRLTGRDEQRPEVGTRKLEAGRAALEALERGLAERDFLAGGRYTVPTSGLRVHAHRARGRHRHGRVPGRRWLARVEAQPGFVNDLEPYPPNARVGAGERSVHDPQRGG